MTGSRPLLTLGRRLLLVVLLPTVVLVVSVGGMFAVWVSRSADQALFERARGVVSFFAPAAEAGVRLGNYQELSALLQAALLQRLVPDAVRGRIFGLAETMAGATRMTIIVEADEVGFEQITKQLHKLVSVYKISDFTDEADAEGTRQGWELSLDRLAQLLAG